MNGKIKINLLVHGMGYDFFMSEFDREDLDLEKVNFLITNATDNSEYTDFNEVCTHNEIICAIINDVKSTRFSRDSRYYGRRFSSTYFRSGNSHDQGCESNSQVQQNSLIDGAAGDYSIRRLVYVHSQFKEKFEKTHPALTECINTLKERIFASNGQKRGIPCK